MQIISSDDILPKLILITDSWVVSRGLINLFSEYFVEIGFFKNIYEFEMAVKNHSKSSKLILVLEQKDIPKIKKMIAAFNNNYLIITYTYDKYYQISTESEFIFSIFDTYDDIVEVIQRGLDKIKNSFSDNLKSVLSLREIDILRFVAKGNSSQQIANSLNISLNTVNTHRKNIASKIGIKTASGQTAYAIINNLINTDDAG